MNIEDKKMYAIFSETGRFIGYVDFQPQQGLFKEMPAGFNPVDQIYVGTYENGQVKTIGELQPLDYRLGNADKKWVIYEAQLNEETRRHIEEANDFPLYKQLNLITEALYANKDKLNLTPEFIHMAEVIEDIRYRHRISIESYVDMANNGQINYVPAGQEGEYMEKYTEEALDVTK
jgi:hypothetical protein